MERQLKERLIGAAVLVAAAVVMVPEMFSGAGSSSHQSPADATPAAGQLKTYRIDLHAAQQSIAPEQTINDAPAEQPQDEQPVNPSADVELAANSSASASVSSAPASILSAASTSGESSVNPATPPRVDPSPRLTAKPESGNWVVQVGSFGAQDKAQRIAGDLKGQGYPAFVAPVTVSSKTLYRVRVGGMNERAAADATLQKLQKTYPGASVVPASR